MRTRTAVLSWGVVYTVLIGGLVVGLMLCANEPGQVDEPPFARRIIVSLVAFFGGFALYADGWRRLDKGVTRFGSYARIGLGLLGVVVGLGLWLSSGFRWSWGWWF